MDNLKGKNGHHPRPRVLLIEDDSIMLLVLRTLLEKIGYTVDTATNATEALIKASRGYSLIFSDVGLPGLSGIEIAKIFRAHEKKGSHTPILGITAFSLEDIRDECLEAGMDSVYGKPLNEAKLIEITAQYDSAAGEVSD
ncbi:MAG TPA: response regulator [Gammaproteobacteria bacterium]|jgi:CheY-like chemotaxis protein|nr:response regulator [Gammaproteobacteria bacterium]